ncbi:hypothetical protein [Pseudomonas piscis]|uniref:hypothetical protein n=1 Tax=Pseudomonas piscis TaxID=2614538 RepID=UPI0003B7AE50|nr:hypothetical protein [Pseudomonas piscis]ERO65423.1 hypothetical protein P308_19140 [Pseudomonas piscis]
MHRESPAAPSPVPIKVELLPHDPQRAEQARQIAQAPHPDDSHAYSDCKDAWIQQVQAQALIVRQRRH